MNVFEDAGYFCVDNLPAEMIRSLAELFRHPGSKVERAAVVSDSRGGEYLSALAGVIDELDEAEVVHRVLFLESDEQTLLNRYKETRRRHPLVAARQRGRRRPPRARAARAGARARGLCIDTSGLSPAALRRKVADELLEPGTPGRLAVTLHVVRPQARPAARRRPRASTSASCRTRTTRPTCGRSPGSTSGSSTTSAATAACRSSTTTCCRCSSTCCRSTSPRARRTSSSRSAAPAAATARSRSPSTSARVPRARRVLRRGPAPRRRPGAGAP